MRVLGVDPGTLRTGFGIVDEPRQPVFVAAGSWVTRPADSIETRLLFIYEQLKTALATYRPDVVALEDLFYGRNFRSAVKIGEARALVMLAAAQAGLPMATYLPNLVKQAVVGNGHASKRQIQRMVHQLLGLHQPVTEDAADALAVAICHCHQVRHPLQRNQTLLEAAR